MRIWPIKQRQWTSQCLTLPRKLWSQFSYPGGMEYLPGVDNIPTKTLELSACDNRSPFQLRYHFPEEDSICGLKKQIGGLQHTFF